MFYRPATAGNADDGRSDDAPVVDLDRLRATLRLLFVDETADRIVADAESDSIEKTVRRIASAIGWEWRSAAIHRRLRRSESADIGRPLGPRSGASARGAIALALHLGLGLPIETIGRATSTGAGQLGSDLYQTRLNLEPHINPDCAQFVQSIGRYRDSSLDIAARATLIQHVQHCHACRATLDRFQALDARLIDRIEQERAALPPLVEQTKLGTFAHLRRPLALAAASVLVVAILGAGGYTIATNRGHGAESASTNLGLTGWILTSDYAGNVTALNLASGQQRLLSALNEPNDQVRYTSYWPSSTALSPNGKLIANQLASVTQTPYQELVIEDMSGKEENRIRLTDPYIRFSGWLGNDTVLEVSNPLQESGESASDYFTRAQTESSLIGVNITTGEQHKLLTGAVAEVSPSPDGTMVAILSNFAQSDSGLRTFELRRVEAGRVNGPIVSLSGRASSEPVWAPDGSHVFMATIDAPVIVATPTPNILASPTPAPLQPTKLISIARDGTMQTLSPQLDGERNVPLTISPDGTRLMVEAMRLSGSTYQYRLAEVALATGTARWMTAWSPYALMSPVWSPDGTTLLGMDRRPFLVSAIDAVTYSDVLTNRLIALPKEGDPFAVMTRMAGDIGTEVFSWLPEDAFSEPAATPMPVRLSEPQPVSLSKANLGIETSAQVSGDGDYVILNDSDEKRPTIWDWVNDNGRELPAGTHDLSWFPDIPAVIGVGSATPGQPDAPSRLATFASTFSVSLPSYDYRMYDPAEIGSSLVKQYATPLMSPNENALAFFLLDTRDHSVALWLADYDVPAKPVAHWALPNDNKLAYVPVAGWIDNQTLLFAEPSDWHSGLPGTIRLNRLTIQPNGSASIDTAITLRTHGTERGLDLAELALNQRSGHIAFRLRHFSSLSIDQGVTDTIEITTAADPSDTLEVDRFQSSSGLSWSPDGRFLVAMDPFGLQIYSASGRALFGASGLHSPTDPRWIDQNNIWFNETDDQGTHIMMVQLQ